LRKIIGASEQIVQVCIINADKQLAKMASERIEIIDFRNY